MMLSEMHRKHLERTKFCALAAAYGQMQPKNSMHPWTREEAITLGQLFTQLHGEMPNWSRLRRHYYLPDKQAILRLFGSIPAYWAALQEVPHGHDRP